MAGGHALPPSKELDRRLDRIRPYTHPVRRLRTYDQDYFRDRFELENSRLNTFPRLTEALTYIFPYRGPLGRLRGYVERRSAWKGHPVYTAADWGGPKTMTYPHTTEPVLGWYRGASLEPRAEMRHYADARGHVVLVEDCVSALKVAEVGLTAVALLGTGLNAEKVRDIARQHPRCVTLALDPDAQGTAQQMARKWGMYFERVRVVALEADPKDIPKASLREELGIV